MAFWIPREGVGGSASDFACLAEFPYLNFSSRELQGAQGGKYFYVVVFMFFDFFFVLGWGASRV